MNYFASMGPNDIWRAKALIAQYPKRPRAHETMDVRYDGGVPPPVIHETMEVRYDPNAPPQQDVPLSTNDVWRARALIAEYPAKSFGAASNAAPREQADDYFRNFGGPMSPPLRPPEGIQEGVPVDRPVPTFQSPGEIQAPNMDALYGRLGEARENYQRSRGGFERAGDYAAETATDFARAMANEASFETADMARALVDGISNDDDFSTNLARQRAESEQAQKRSPVATKFGEHVGDAALGAVPAFKGAKKAYDIWKRFRTF
jgi:hypothetical protein